MNGFSLGPIKNLGAAALSLVVLVLLGAGAAAWQAGAANPPSRPGQRYVDAYNVVPVSGARQPDKPTPSPSRTITATGTLTATGTVSPTRTGTVTATLTL